MANIIMLYNPIYYVTINYFVKFKSLRKSSSPNINSKILVPKINFMCQLIKYYETENTIFLLLEYFPHGKLFNHLNNLLQNGALYLKQLSNMPLDSVEKAQISLNRRKSLTLKLNSSFTNLEAAYKPKRRSKSFRMNAEAEIDYGTNKNSFRQSRIDLEMITRKRIFSPSSSSMSSTDSSKEKNVNNRDANPINKSQTAKEDNCQKSDSSSCYNSSDSTNLPASKTLNEAESSKDTSNAQESIFTIETRKWFILFLCSFNPLTSEPSLIRLKLLIFLENKD